MTVELRFLRSVTSAGRTLAVEIEHGADEVVTGRERVIAAWLGRGIPALVAARREHKLPHTARCNRWFRTMNLSARAQVALRRANALDLSQAALDRLELFAAEADRQAKWTYLRQARLREAAWALGLEKRLTEEDLGLTPKERTKPARPKRKRKPYPNVRI